jgi:hypothetical protein
MPEINLKPNMTTKQIKRGMQFTYETNYRFPALKNLRKAILQYGEANRHIVAEVVMGHGFETHIGGHHVAVMQGGVRLALITSKTQPDFN